MKLMKIAEAALGLGLIVTAAAGDELGAVAGAVLVADAFGVRLWG